LLNNIFVIDQEPVTVCWLLNHVLSGKDMLARLFLRY